MSPDRATQLFDASRATLRQAVPDGELQSYREAREPKGGPRRFSGAQLALLYDLAVTHISAEPTWWPQKLGSAANLENASSAFLGLPRPHEKDVGHSKLYDRRT